MPESSIVGQSRKGRNACHWHFCLADILVPQASPSNKLIPFFVVEKHPLDTTRNQKSSAIGRTNVSRLGPIACVFLVE